MRYINFFVLTYIQAYFHVQMNK